MSAFEQEGGILTAKPGSKSGTRTS